MPEIVIPPEIFEKFVHATDGDYMTQARLCRVSHAFATMTQPRLYASFNSSLLSSTTRYTEYLGTISRNKHLGKLVKKFYLETEYQNWPRDISTALLWMPNLKDLTLINSAPPDAPIFHDIWREFQSDRIPFRLDTFKINLRTSDNSRPFESFALSHFLRRQNTLQSINISYHTAFVSEHDIPNLRKANIDSSNWDYLLPGRPIQSLVLAPRLQNDQRQNFKQVVPGSPIAKTLQSLKRLRIDAEILKANMLPLYLSSLEDLVVTRFSEASQSL